jgi:isoquinoline 1-oxidoreductase beta subunit
MNIIPRPSFAARIENLSRRSFLKQAGGLALGLYFAPLLADQGTAAPGSAGSGQAAAVDFAPDAFLRIGPDDRVTVIAKHLEMGQGTYTGLATLIAEELDADWAQVTVEGAPADTARYKNLLMGIQGTGGSTAIAESFEQMRKAGAAARAMLVAAAAQEWNVPAAEIAVERGVVMHRRSKRRARLGELAEKAAAQPVPKEVRLKAPHEFNLIGKQKLPRKDSPAKTDGSAIFTQDFKHPDLLVAVVAHPPRFWGKIKRLDASAAQALPGVVAVIQYAGKPGSFQNGVAVLGRTTWQAWKGRDALKIEWDDSGFKLGSREIFARYRELAGKPGLIARQDGDAQTALANGRSAKVIEADYEFPYLAHAAMEPMNCVVQLGEGTCEIWNGEQLQSADQAAVAAFLGIAPAKVTIHQLYAGGSFGRRANPQADYVLEAVAIARAARARGLHAPVKLVWTREEDTRGGWYRPAYLHRVRAALQASGAPLAWHQRIVGQSIAKGSPFESALVNHGIDETSVEGAADLPYAIPNVQVELVTPDDIAVPVQWWRSVGHTHTAYVGETLIDELAAAAGQDPYQYRRALLANQPRHRGVLELAAAQAGWHKPLRPGASGVRRGRGIAVHKSFNSYVAQVAEVAVQADGRFKVERVVCAVDCGIAVNPDVIRAQMEGGIGYALAAALHSAITLKDGVVEQANFNTYPPLRIDEMPAVEVHIAPSDAHPTGVGEPGVPPLAPAVANALYTATGKRLRKLPFDPNELKA